MNKCLELWKLHFCFNLMDELLGQNCVVMLVSVWVACEECVRSQSCLRVCLVPQPQKVEPPEGLDWVS